MTTETGFRADSLAFFAPQGRPPVADQDLPHNVDLMHVTAAAPFFNTMQQLRDGGFSPDGERHIPGVGAFANAVEGQDQLTLVRTQAELAVTLGRGTTAIVMGLQQAPHDASIEDLKWLQASGVSVVALEYQSPNQQYGSGWLDPSGPLTDQGKELLVRMKEANLILDLSHSGDRTARDATEFIASEGLELPVMASHGGVREWYEGNPDDVNNKRNLSLRTLEGIKELGGVIGIYQLTFGLSETENTPTPFYNQLYRAIVEFPNSVVIGSDAVYRTRTTEEWEETSAFLMRNIAGGTDMVPRHPETPIEHNGPDRLSVIGDYLARATDLSSEQVAGAIGQTLVSFFARSLAR